MLKRSFGSSQKGAKEKQGLVCAAQSTLILPSLSFPPFSRWARSNPAYMPNPDCSLSFFSFYFGTHGPWLRFFHGPACVLLQLDPLFFTWSSTCMSRESPAISLSPLSSSLHLYFFLSLLPLLSIFSLSPLHYFCYLSQTSFFFFFLIWGYFFSNFLIFNPPMPGI